MIPLFTNKNSPVLDYIGAINHDAAVATVHEGILFASHSERYSKKKNDPDLHHALIRDAIRYSGTPDIIVAGMRSLF